MTCRAPPGGLNLALLAPSGAGADLGGTGRTPANVRREGEGSSRDAVAGCPLGTDTSAETGSQIGGPGNSSGASACAARATSRCSQSTSTARCKCSASGGAQSSPSPIAASCPGCGSAGRCDSRSAMSSTSSSGCGAVSSCWHAARAAELVAADSRRISYSMPA